MLSYLSIELNKHERRKVMKSMSDYHKLNAIIESKCIDLYPSHTQVIEDKPSQSVRGFHSEVEDFAMKSEEINEYRQLKRKLDLAYHSVSPTQKLIWDECFIDEKNDTDIYHGYDITRRTYYREKRELILFVAGCLNVGTIKTQQNTQVR